MKILFATLYTLFTFSLSFAQCDVDEELAKNNCTQNHKYSAIDRLKNYPFNEVYDIYIISSTKLEAYYKKQVFLDSLLQKETLFKEELFHESEKLSLSEIDTLTNIIYNYGPVGNPTVFQVTECYMPHNAILFFNSEHKLFAFIEICFDCDNIRTSGKNITMGEDCNQKLSMLKTFFLDHGITFVSDM